MNRTTVDEIQETKRQFLSVVTGEYRITGFFWIFSTLGSLVLFNDWPTAETFFFSMFVLMLSNGLWEILTGWYADKFKRQFSMSAGFLACLVGFCLMGIAVIGPAPQRNPVYSVKFLVWGVGVSIWSLGPALLSGAQEAWLVDRCNFFSKHPPEDVDEVFKESAWKGVIAKSIGALVCFSIFLVWKFFWKNQDNEIFFISSAIIAAILSGRLFYRSKKLREEYWSHPKYQTNESLSSFLLNGIRDLWKKPFRWFAISYVGVMSLTYVVSSTVWVYMVINKSASYKELILWAVILIVAELIGSLLSGYFSKWIDLIKKQWLRIPVASLLYLAPLPFLFLFPAGFLYILIVAAFSFRAVHASVFGSLNTIGQLAIKSDERRAILISMSSAISSFLMSGVFYLFYRWSADPNSQSVSLIEDFWRYVPFPLILILFIGRYLVAHQRSEAS